MRARNRVWRSEWPRVLIALLLVWAVLYVDVIHGWLY